MEAHEMVRDEEGMPLWAKLILDRLEREDDRLASEDGATERGA